MQAINITDKSHYQTATHAKHSGPVSFACLCVSDRMKKIEQEIVLLLVTAEERTCVCVHVCLLQTGLGWLASVSLSESRTEFYPPLSQHADWLRQRGGHCQCASYRDATISKHFRALRGPHHCYLGYLKFCRTSAVTVTTDYCCSNMCSNG